MSIIIKSSTRINSKTTIGGVAASAPSADILSSWGVAYVSGVGVTLTDVAGYTVPAGTDAIITGPLNLNDGVTLTVADTATLTIN